MGTRNNNRKTQILDDELYREILSEKGVQKIPRLLTPTISNVSPTLRGTLRRVEHIWGPGDHFYKLAQKHYGDPKLWWVIAWYNTTPTESHVKVGDLIRIPFPLETALFYFNNPRE